MGARKWAHTHFGSPFSLHFYTLIILVHTTTGLDSFRSIPPSNILHGFLFLFSFSFAVFNFKPKQIIGWLDIIYKVSFCDCNIPIVIDTRFMGLMPSPRYSPLKSQYRCCGCRSMLLLLLLLIPVLDDSSGGDDGDNSRHYTRSLCFRDCFNLCLENAMKILRMALSCDHKANKNKK